MTNGVHTPLCPILNEIVNASKGGFPFVAIAMTLALPDICVSLESADGRSNGAKYAAWCDQNLPREHFSFVTGEDLFSMRCGVLHNGRYGDLKHNVARVIFALPNNPAGKFINGKLHDAYFYSVEEFCLNFTSAVHDWMENKVSDPTVQANLPRLMQYYPNGIFPYAAGTGMALIA